MLCSGSLDPRDSLRYATLSAAFRRGIKRVVIMGRDGTDAKRVTTTLTISRKSQLEQLAKREGVKEAWVVRRAVERYLDEIGDGSVLKTAGGHGNARG